MDFNWQTMLAIGGALTVVAATWRSAVTFFTSVRGFFIDKLVANDVDQNEAIIGFLRAEGRMIRLSFRVITARCMFITDVGRSEDVSVERFFGLFLVRCRGSWFIVNVANSGGLNNNGSPAVSSAPESHAQYKLITFSFLRGRVDVDAIILAAMQRRNDLIFGSSSGLRPRNRFRVETFFGHGNTMMVMGGGEQGAPPTTAQSEAPTLANTQGGGHYYTLATLGSMKLLGSRSIESLSNSLMLGNGDPFDARPYPAEIMRLAEDLDHWLNNRNWFIARSIQWRMGWMFTGEQGTGKSSFITACAIKYDMPVYCFDLASMNNKELRNFFECVEASAPSFAVFEDIDRVFEGVSNIARPRGGGVTLDGFLNTIQGVRPGGGVVVILTCNNPSKLDKAIGIPVEELPTEGFKVMRSSRPGRIDRVAQFGFVEESARRIIAGKILAGVPGVDMDAMIKAGDKMSASSFSDLCVQKARVEFQDRKLKH